ncbi:fructuronate reductase [Microbacterium natoriense]|uniref:Mannitol-1-phosphate 5-dehydrogenase n=1 Tax=Microbacterium natoriense TaxID=284570 RepID=A0AAW8F387_9MICO|nr:mannitol dehydrogenase family protein [Microbacterium natoriense]MDQ0649554.1 fructuronate reductase [Microbacterium natoriense]
MPPTIAHLGVGAFHRAHQAWYTDRAGAVGEPWRIAAFTGRSATQARLLEARGGTYTLITRAADGDEISEVRSIRSVHDGADAHAWQTTMADPDTHILTLTITEAGYRDGTAATRIARGLQARRTAGGGALTVISCDNLSDNGGITRAVVFDAAMAIDHRLADWIDDNVVFLSSMVDRITPRTTDADIDEVERIAGIRDHGTVVTEPFSEWVIEEGFVGPRPAWDQVGVRTTRDLAPFEQRKLRILNGAHSLLAYQGLLRGFDDVAGAFADPELRELVEDYWQSAAASCELPRGEIDEAIAATRARFANPRIRHRLAQIALDGAHKLPVRIVPVLANALASGDRGDAAASAIAAWAVRDGRSSEQIAQVLGEADAAARAMRTAVDRGIRRLEDSTVRAVRGDAVRS